MQPKTASQGVAQLLNGADQTPGHGKAAVAAP